MSTNNACHNVMLAQAEQVSPLLLISKLDLSEVDEEKLVMVFDNDVTQKLTVTCNDMSSPEMFVLLTMNLLKPLLFYSSRTMKDSITIVICFVEQLI
jgi:hypothetical protein